MSQNKEKQVIDLKVYEELEKNEVLLRKVIRIAQFESELDLGVNPACFDQADTGFLSEGDFEYIKRVGQLVEKRLKDICWLAKTIEEVDHRSLIRHESVRGIKFDDELFKASRGILEAFIQKYYPPEKE